MGGIIGAIVFPPIAVSQASVEPPLEQWAVAPGHAVEVDASGFSLPTAIATIDSPGSAPDDPRYFVAELRGSIKAVTNDRDVIELASVPTFEPSEETLGGSSQSGLAALCVAEEAGLVFGTFAYPDEGGVLRNDVVRIDTGPGFSTEAHSITRFSDIFAEFQSSAAHQIGGCYVDGDRLYIGIGDGGNVAAVRDEQVLLGKVLCLDLDGDPCPDNPFIEQGGAAAYVLGLGFRNPFGIHAVHDTLFVAENGRDLDRLLRVQPGADHLWDGTDASIATGADLVFDPAVSPVHLDHIDVDHPVLGDTLGNHFVISVFNREPRTGVMIVDYDHARQRPRNVPRFLVQHVGEEPQHVIAGAVGSDGVYLAGAFPGPDGTSEILRVYPAPDAPHPVEIEFDWGQPTDERAQLLLRHSCASCHGAMGEGGIGPSLDGFGLRWRLRERLNTPGYEERVRALNQQAGSDEQGRVEAREAVLEVEGAERVAVWMEHFLLDPQFDNPDSQMPNPNLSPAEAQELTSTLVGGAPPGYVERAVRFVRGNPRAIAVGFAGGTGATLALGMVLTGAVWLRRRRADNDDRQPPDHNAG